MSYTNLAEKNPMVKRKEVMFLFYAKVVVKGLSKRRNYFYQNRIADGATSPLLAASEITANNKSDNNNKLLVETVEFFCRERRKPAATAKV